MRNQPGRFPGFFVGEKRNNALATPVEMLYTKEKTEVRN